MQRVQDGQLVERIAGILSQFGLFRDGVQLCSGLVDLVICVGHHGGGGHRLTLAGERFVDLVAEDIAEVGDRGVDLGIGRTRHRSSGESTDRCGLFVASDSVEQHGEDWHRVLQERDAAGVVVAAGFVIDALALSAKGKGRDELLWPSRSGGYLGPPSSHEWWLSGAVARCQQTDPTFPRITADGLRHTAASLAIGAGANPKVVQRMLGHASAAMTLDVYADLFDSDHDEVAVTVSKMWPRTAN